jgi:hypothetical protein
MSSYLHPQNLFLRVTAARGQRERGRAVRVHLQLSAATAKESHRGVQRACRQRVLHHGGERWRLEALAAFRRAQARSDGVARGRVVIMIDLGGVEDRSMGKSALTPALLGWRRLFVELLISFTTTVLMVIVLRL